MEKGIPCPVEPSNMSISCASNALHGQTETLHNMLSSLEDMLYGGMDMKTTAPEQKCEGIEASLTDTVHSMDRALTRLERIISKL